MQSGWASLRPHSKKLPGLPPGAPVNQALPPGGRGLSVVSLPTILTRF